MTREGVRVNPCIADPVAQKAGPSEYGLTPAQTYARWETGCENPPRNCQTQPFTTKDSGRRRHFSVRRSDQTQVEDRVSEESRRCSAIGGDDCLQRMRDCAARSIRVAALAVLLESRNARVLRDYFRAAKT